MAFFYDNIDDVRTNKKKGSSLRICWLSCSTFNVHHACLMCFVYFCHLCVCYSILNVKFNFLQGYFNLLVTLFGHSVIGNVYR